MSRSRKAANNVTESQGLFASDVSFDADDSRLEANYENKTNRFQDYALQPTYRYVTATAPSIFIESEILNQTAMIIPAPYNTVVGFGLMNVNLLVGDAARALLSRAAPFAYARKYGKGNVCLGLTKEAAKFVAGCVLPAAVGYGAGYLMMSYGDQLATSDNVNLQRLSAVLTHDVTSVAITSAISMGLSGATKWVLERIPCMNLPDLQQEDNPALHVLQRATTHLITRPFNALVMFEVMRQALLFAQADAVLHDSRVTALVVAMDQMLQAWAYSAFVAHPIRHLVPNQVAVVNPDRYVPLLAQYDEARQLPSAKAQAQALTWYGIRTATVLATGGYLMNWAMSQMHTEDKETLDFVNRIAYNAGLVAGAILIERAFENAPTIFSWLSEKVTHCRATLFNCCAPAKPNLKEDYVSDHSFLADATYKRKMFV